MDKSRNPVRKVSVNLGDKAYPIHIGENTLPNIGQFVKTLELGSKIMVVTNPTVRSLYGRTVIDSLIDAGFDVVLGEVPDGEKYKSLDSAKILYDIAFDHGLDRKCGVLALGGGVIGDLAGFVAATYMRGLPFIQVPTTLLAQVDSSVGGKVAVNHPRGKNIIGSFYQPKMVYTDILTLSTLPIREFRAGMAEVIKYGVIWDRSYFDFLRNNQSNIEKLDPETIIQLVGDSCEIKAKVVEQDETEHGIRAILNFGHTFGHAFETLTRYQKYVHGEAVAIGMVSAARVAVKLNMLSAEEEKQVQSLIISYGLPSSFGDLKLEEIIDAMYHDKKAEGGRIRYVLPETIGRVSIVNDVPLSVISEVLNGQKDS